MSTDTIVDLYTRGLAEGFLHPDGAPRVLSNYRHQALPPEMAEEVQKQTRGMAEALVHHAEHNGYEWISKAEAAELRAQAAKAEGAKPQTVEVWCSNPNCEAGAPLLSLAATGDRVTTHGPTLIGALHRREATCPHAVTT